MFKFGKEIEEEDQFWQAHVGELDQIDITSLQNLMLFKTEYS